MERGPQHLNYYIHRGWLDDEFAKRGTRLVALDDWGDDSHEGQLLKYIKGWQAKGESRKTAEQSRRNKRRKAREGKVVGGPKAAYGFRYVRNEKGKGVGCEVDEAEMQTVRRIFSEVASGKGLRPLKDELDLERVPTPGGGRAWSRTWIKRIVQNDLYKPHTVDELREAGVAGEVISRLEADEVHGVYRFEGIPVPIPDAGIPLEVVLEARRRMETNRSPSRAGDRFGELSGGILYCEECGRRMQHIPTTPRGTTYHYYRCVGTTGGKADPCGMRTYVPAVEIEEEVYAAVGRLMDDKEYVLQNLEQHVEQKRKVLSRAGADAATLARRLGEIEAKRAKYQRAHVADAISLADLKKRRAELDAEEEANRRELERRMRRDEELERLAQTEAEIRERVEAADNNLEDRTPEERHELYRDLRLRVEVGEDKRPRISGVFPVRIGAGRGWVVQTPRPRGEWPVGPGPEGFSKKDTSYARGGP